MSLERRDMLSQSIRLLIWIRKMRETNTPTTLEEAIALIGHQRRELSLLRIEIAALKGKDSSQSTIGLADKKTLLSAMLGLVRYSSAQRLSKVDMQVVHDSGLFDEEFYIEELKGRSDSVRASKAPLKHYLRVGAFEGLDPSPQFDSDWYLATNSDVKAVGLNPLVHYIKHGRYEGRMPKLGAKGTVLRGEPVSASGFNRKLWNGFPHIALSALEQRADQELNSEAAWYLASWCYAHGDLETALERVEQSIVNSPSGANQRGLIGLTKCYALLDQRPGIEKIMEDPNNVRQLGSAYPYIQANLLSCQSRWSESLSAVNGVFYRVGMTGITLKDSSAPPRLDSLADESASIGAASPILPAEGLPLISVVVPAYNAGGTLHIALEGLLAQTWPALEVIVVDDGSSDNTAEVARAYAERDSRVRYLPNPRNMGAYPTRNRGMKAAKGEYVTVHDSDDWSHPQKLERQLQPLINDPSNVASFSSWVRVTAEMRFVGPWLLSEAFVEKNHSSAVMRREVLEEIGYWDEVNVAGDTEFLWRLEHNYGHQNIVHVLPTTPLSFALADDTSLTRTKATHVKTIHYGLRRIYRESAQWWHRYCEGKPVLDPSQARDDSNTARDDKNTARDDRNTARGSSRPFPVPLGIVRGSNSEFDQVLVGNFAVEGEQLDLTLKAIDRCVAERGEFCLFHWPDYLGWHGASIADEVFDLCHKHGLSFAHMGLTLSAAKVLMIDDELWRYPPSHSVQIEGLERVESVEGNLVQPQAELVDYFVQGGVQSMAGL